MLSSCDRSRLSLWICPLWCMAEMGEYFGPWQLPLKSWGNTGKHDGAHSWDSLELFRKSHFPLCSQLADYWSLFQELVGGGDSGLLAICSLYETRAQATFQLTGSRCEDLAEESEVHCYHILTFSPGDMTSKSLLSCMGVSHGSRTVAPKLDSESTGWS